MKKIFTTCALALVSFWTQSQTLIWQDNFEDPTATTIGGGTRTPSSSFITNTNRYFSRVSAANIATSLPYTGLEGTFFWGAEDADNGNTQSPRQSVTWTGINITGRNSISFKGTFAIGTATVWDHGTSTSITDHMIVEYRVNGGNWVEALRFFPNIANSASGALALETTGDSLGDGAALNSALTEYAFNIPTKGTTLDLRFRVSVNALVEELAIDNFRLFETVAAPTVVVTANNTPLTFENCLGTPSSAKEFIVSGTSLTNNVVITAPDGFQVSTNGGALYASGSILTPTAGTLAATNVLVRLSPTTAGDRTGNITITSTGAESKSVAVVGTTNPIQDRSAAVTAVSPICSGNSTTVTIAGTKGITYTVKDPNNTVLGSIKALANGNISLSTIPLTAPNGPSNYTLTVTASVPTCGDVALLATPTVLVNPAQNPSATVTATSPICFGATSTVTIAATNGIVYSLIDQNDNVLGGKKAVNTGPLSITTPAFTTGGTHRLEVSASVAGCNIVYLTTKPEVVVADSIDSKVTAVGPVLTATRKGASYQWKNCNGQNIEGATEVSYTAANSGEYAVVITVGNCSKTSVCVPVVITDVNDREFANAVLSVYPNPSKGAVTITAATAGVYRLYDQRGSLTAIIQLSADNNYKVTQEGLSSGVYLLSGVSEGKNITQKIVVE